METDPELLRWSSSKPSNNDTNDPGPSQLVTAKERDRGWPEESISSLSSEDDSL